MTKFENKLINHARLLAPLCQGGRCKHISFLVRRSTIKSIGINQFKTDTLSARFKYRNDNRHSELVAIKNFDYTRNSTPIHHCTMYNIRIRPGGLPAFSYPCKNCVELLKAFEIKRVFYTGDNGVFYNWNDPIPSEAYQIMKVGKMNANKPLVLPGKYN